MSEKLSMNFVKMLSVGTEEDPSIIDRLKDTLEEISNYHFERSRPSFLYNVTLRKTVANYNGRGNVEYWTCTYHFVYTKEDKDRESSKFTSVIGIDYTPEGAKEAFDIAMRNSNGYHSCLTTAEMGKSDDNRYGRFDHKIDDNSTGRISFARTTDELGRTGYVQNNNSSLRDII